MRQEGFWPLKGLTAVKKAIHDCIPCKKLHKPLVQQKMAPLPDFTHVGVDYAGLLLITKNQQQKRYILLFTCAVTRAVHLELTKTLNLEDFMKAFQRFVSIPYPPHYTLTMHKLSSKQAKNLQNKTSIGASAPPEPHGMVHSGND